LEQKLAEKESNNQLLLEKLKQKSDFEIEQGIETSPIFKDFKNAISMLNL